jgi:hypothetical protein
MLPLGMTPAQERRMPRGSTTKAKSGRKGGRATAAKRRGSTATKARKSTARKGSRRAPRTETPATT